MKQIKLAINGFGRIGRQAFKIALDQPEASVVAINDLTSPDILAYLLRYDSNYRKNRNTVTSDEKHVIVNGVNFPVFAEKDPEALPWKDLGVDVVLECTGRFTDSEKAGAHLKAGAKKVIISAPAHDSVTPTFVLGVNDTEYKSENIVSNASCTTNCITPVVHVIEQAFGIKKVLMTTVHSYTAEQNLVDAPPPGLHAKDLTRARSAAVNIVPTSTGATIAATEAIPSLKGKFGGLSIRVPTPVGSLSDFVFLLNKETTVDEVNETLTRASQEERLRGILEVSNEPLVSSDIIGNAHSAIVDLSLTQVIDGDLVKVVAWYDNEYGYSNRLVEQAIAIGAGSQN